MKVLIVYAHPSKKSYTYQILKQLQTHLEIEGIDYETADLYAMNFKSDMSGEEYEREGFSKFDLPISLDVRAEHEKIEKADCIIFVYPVWWSDCPAKLKGWFDRVYAVGYAYGKSASTTKMKIIKYGLVICTAGHPNAYLQEIGIAESMRNVMIDDRLGNRFLNKEMIILGGTLDKAQVAQIHTQLINTVGKKIKNNCA